ncbi:LacI family DNA-binding transcriptional regulator, partial [Candidatus Bipolaricaulota bacterium]|nr:LacI family DNA-binding transcriptional regulator [Candidatus Bipolaricaulota bacterium]
IKDIAKELGISASTVSRALSDSPLVNAETKRAILEVAKRLGYQRNELARALVMGSSGAVGLLVPDITNPFFSDVARGVGEIADRIGVGVILCNTDGRIDRELNYIRLMRRKRVDGLLLCSTTIDAPYLKELELARVPFILVSRLSGQSDVPFVITDDEAGARLAVEHLVDLGHTSIGFIGGPENVQASRDRMETYLNVLNEHGLAALPDWRCYAGFTQAAGREAAQRMLSLPDRPTAIFAANDVTALGVLEVAEGVGLRVPSDLSLIGYDDISYASLPRIQLTTVAQPAVEMGQIAADWLFAAIENPEIARLHRTLTPRLVVRSTTAPVSR